MVYTVTFNPALDYVVRMDEFRAGDINRTQSEEVQFGGKGINVSAVLRNLGISNVAMGFLAGFTGQALERGLRENGIQTDFIWLPEGLTRINVKIKAGEETEINGQGPAIPAAAHRMGAAAGSATAFSDGLTTGPRWGEGGRAPHRPDHHAGRLQQVWHYHRRSDLRHKKWYCPGFLPSSTIFSF